MRTGKRLRLAIVGAAVSVISPFALAGLGASEASADIPGNFTTGIPAPYISATSPGSPLTNHSDPDAEACTYNGVSGYCVYTSQDTGLAPNDCDPVTGACQNYYPMVETTGYFSSDGINWTPEGNRDGVSGGIFNESAYVNAGWTPAGAQHLWAPNVENVDGTYYLLDPDVSSLGDEDTSSFIGVSTSSSPFGPFTLHSRIGGDPTVNGGYASDPDLVRGGDGRTYLVYANGDAHNCGGLSIGYVNKPNFTGFHTGWPKNIVINGDGVLGSCGGTGHPYMEGPSLYYTPNFAAVTGLPGPYLLVFAAKPANGTPTQCGTNAGEPGSDNEVIAYATASTPGGPYNYQGILMCGSSNEWTDQASLVPMVDQHGTIRIVLVYHDGPAPSTGRNRSVHAECLMYGGGKLAGALRSGGTDYSNSGAVQCLESNEDTHTPTGGGGGSNGSFALMTEDTNQIVTVASSSGNLSAARSATGPSEGFKVFPGPMSNPLDPASLIFNASNLNGVTIVSQTDNFVTAPSTSTVLNANTDIDQVGSKSQFHFHLWSDGSVTIAPDSTNRGVAVQGDQTLISNGPVWGGSQGLQHFWLLHY